VIVADASAVVDLLTDPGPRGDWVAGQFVTDVHAPHLIDAEVSAALRRLVLRDFLTARRAREALSSFAELDIERYPMTELLGRVWALRNAISAYDAMYIVLGEALDAPLVTTDERLARARGHHARIVGYPA